MNPSASGDMRSGAGGGGGSSGAGGGGGGGVGGGANMSPHGIPMEPIHMMIRKIWKENAKTLQNCAFVHGYFGFHRCIMSLMDRCVLDEYALLQQPKKLM